MNVLRVSALTFVGFLAFFTAFFLPAEFGRLMASGDALLESAPAFLGTHRLWEPALLLGYPLFADPNQQFFYPLAWVHFLPHTFNAFAVAPFVLAAVGMAGFVRLLTRSATAGVVAGLVYALGGFMISHAGQLMLSHPAAWAPFVLWAIESLRRGGGNVALAAAAVALGLCGLSGQPQILAFTATLAVAYAIVSAAAAKHGPPGFLLLVAAALALGFAFAGAQLIPEAALARDSTRSALDYDAFTAFAIPAAELPVRLAFPYLLGASTFSSYPYSRFDLGTFTEDTVAVGLVALALALLASARLRDDRRVAFWFAISLLALTLAAGDATPLARIAYHVPPYDLFRLPGRHAFEFTFAIAVLAGYGCAALTNGRVRAFHLLGAFVAVVIFATAAYAQLAIGHPPLTAKIAATYGVDASRIVSPLLNGAVGIPLATGLFGLMMVVTACLFARSAANANAGGATGKRVRLRSFVATALVVVAVAVDCGAFGWSAYWNWGAALPAELAAPSWAASLAERLHATHTRVAWLPGILASGMRPNLTTLWDVPLVGGYTPLVPRRAQDFLGLTPAGGMSVPGVDDTALDLAGASVVATAAQAPAPVSAAQPFASTAIHAFLGPPSESVAAHAGFGLPAPFAATRLAMVSELGNAPAIPDNAEVAQIDITDIGGHHERQSILAGRDTAEFAYDRADVRPIVRHRRATIYSGDAATHEYVTYFTIATEAPVARIDVRWTYPASALGALTIEKLSLLDETSGTAAAFGEFAALYAAPDHWRPLALAPGLLAFENLRVMPEVWFAAPVASDRDAAGRAIHGGLLPDGTPFDDARDVMTEARETNSAPAGVGGRMRIVEDRPSGQTVTTSCARACFLVFRDAFDSQWRATIDGRPAAFVPADLALRGLSVPAGTHLVTTTFAPTSLYAGLASSALAVFCLLGLAVRPRVTPR